MKKFISTLLIMLVFTLITSCGKKEESNTKNQSSKKFDFNSEISVTSREEGSGTRGAFIELFQIEEKDSKGMKVDHTTDEANITNSTSVMMTNVSMDKYAIGYISLGSLNDTVKALKIDGVEATSENIKSGKYKVARPFIIVTKDGLSEVAKDFFDYILSKEGQQIVEDNGYIGELNSEAYIGNKPSGKIVVAGSSSISPVMEKLKEGYLKVNTNARIEIQTSDSTTGITSTIDGICDIGMASRELKDKEQESGLKATKIAMDGIAVIVNNDNTNDNLTSEQVKSIFTGKVYTWEEVM